LQQKIKSNIFDFKLCVSQLLETSMTHMALAIKNFADPNSDVDDIMDNGMIDTQA